MVAYSILWATTIGTVCSRVPIWHRSHAIMQTVMMTTVALERLTGGKGARFRARKAKVEVCLKHRVSPCRPLIARLK